MESPRRLRPFLAVALATTLIGASVGIVPVFWSVGACLAAGGFLARRGGR